MDCPWCLSFSFTNCIGKLENYPPKQIFEIHKKYVKICICESHPAEEINLTKINLGKENKKST